ncbi:MAG: hypothetical protein IT159_15940 [Bryobacterales bacterium]|nr:hypothetical protein [Bryobacterales bacterium]
MVTLEHDSLVFRFPSVHADARLAVNFRRTLRVPDDNREYPLPPGLGSFPLLHVDDYAERTPSAWSAHGGVFLPMYQAEALWIRFDRDDYPFAVKIAAGKIDAVTGGPWSPGLTAEPQDYLVTDKQPWLDGFCIAKGHVRQFVAMPLGEGFTAEEQLTGAAEHGGVQIVVYPMKAEVYEEAVAYRRMAPTIRMRMRWAVGSPVIGLAPGGLIRQKVYKDPHGISAWDLTQSSRCFVHILNSAQYRAVTGRMPPTEPLTAQAYTNAGLPWFDYYAADQAALAGSPKLASLDSVAAMGIKKGASPLTDNVPVNPGQVIRIRPDGSTVREGSF